MITRSKARFRQSLGRVASPRAGPSRRTSAQHHVSSHQSSEGVGCGVKVVGGRHSTSPAAGSKKSSGQSKICDSKNCLTCPDNKFCPTATISDALDDLPDCQGDQTLKIKIF